MRFAILLTTALMIASAKTSFHAQSLVEVAKKAADKQAAEGGKTGGESSVKKSFDNEDLRSTREARSAATTAERRATPNVPAAPALSPEAAAILDGIRAKCAKQWPEDFRMQKFCGDRQIEALGKVANRSMDTSSGQVIRRKCLREWPGDFRMRNYCEEQQLKALAALSR